MHKIHNGFHTLGTCVIRIKPMHWLYSKAENVFDLTKKLFQLP